MRVSSTKVNDSSNSHSSKSFFDRSGSQSFFFGNQEVKTPFFTTSIIQPKLTIGQPNDKYEQEADSMADKVVQKLDSSSTSTPVQKKCESCEEDERLQKKEEELEVLRKPIFESDREISGDKIRAKSNLPNLQLSPGLESNLQSTKGKGNPLSRDVRTDMESGFGTDFKNVRIHTDNNAVQMNRKIGAKAFTNGSDIYFNKGNYSTNSRSGKHLLAHELTHVLQQKGNNTKYIQRNLDASSASCTQIQGWERRNCSNRNGRLRSRIGRIVHSRIQQRFRARSRLNNITELVVPRGELCRFGGSTQFGRTGSADLVKVTRRGARGGNIFTVVGEIKPITTGDSGLVSGELQAGCYSAKIQEHGEDCLVFGRNPATGGRLTGRERARARRQLPSDDAATMRMCERLGAFRGRRSRGLRNPNLGRRVQVEPFPYLFPFSPMFFQVGNNFVYVRRCLPNVIGYTVTDRQRRLRCAERRSRQARSSSSQITARVDRSNPSLIRFNFSVTPSHAIRFIWPVEVPFNQPLAPEQNSEYRYLHGTYTTFYLQRNGNQIIPYNHALQSFLPGMQLQLRGQYQRLISQGERTMRAQSSRPFSERIPSWIHPSAREAIMNHDFAQGVSVYVYSAIGDGWGRTVIRASRSGNSFNVGMYKEYPSDLNWYSQNVANGDSFVARMNHRAYTMWNRDLAYYVIGQGMDVHRARNELRRIYRQIFVLMASGFASAFAGASMPGRNPTAGARNMRLNSRRVASSRIAQRSVGRQTGSFGNMRRSPGIPANDNGLVVVRQFRNVSGF